VVCPTAVAPAVDKHAMRLDAASRLAVKRKGFVIQILRNPTSATGSGRLIGVSDRHRDR